MRNNTQYCNENKRIDVYFSKYKLGIVEVDEYNQESRCSNYEKSRQLTADFDMYWLINQIYKHIIESTKNQTKVSTKNH